MKLVTKSIFKKVSTFLNNEVLSHVRNFIDDNELKLITRNINALVKALHSYKDSAFFFLKIFNDVFLKPLNKDWNLSFKFFKNNFHCPLKTLARRKEKKSSSTKITNKRIHFL